MGAYLYYNDKFICNVSGMEDAERLKKLLSEKQKRLDSIEIALTELVDAVLNMDSNKQKEVIYFAKKLLEKDSEYNKLRLLMRDVGGIYES